MIGPPPAGLRTASAFAAAATVLLACLAAPDPLQPLIRHRSVQEYINRTKALGEEPLPKEYLNTGELLAARNLKPEAHYVITEDGYILALHRASTVKGRGKTPVLILHGLVASSDSWLVTKRQDSLPLVLQDAGYDVWLGDLRGNPNSRRHVQMSPRSKAFWNFSFNECGTYDLPAFIDYILSKTGQKNLIFIGHSMGTTSFFVMASEKPEYNLKIRLAILLAPVAQFPRMEELRTIGAKLLFSNSENIYKVLDIVGIHEVFPRNEGLMKLASFLCTNPFSKEICFFFIYLALGQNINNWDKDRMKLIVASVPAGSSLKNLHHFGQLFQTGKFRKYNYGITGNKEHYDSPTPPAYDLSKVTCPIALYFSRNDIFVNSRTVNETASQLRNVVKTFMVTESTYSHADFVVGLNSDRSLFIDILKLLKSLK